MGRVATLSLRLVLMAVIAYGAEPTLNAQTILRRPRQVFDQGAELEAQAAELLAKGQSKEAERRLDEALSLYRKLLKEIPGDPDAALRMGNILIYRNQCSEALPILKKTSQDVFGLKLSAITAEHQNKAHASRRVRELLLLVGECRLQEGPNEVAFEMLKLSQELPDRLLYLAGRRYLELERLEEALKYLTRYAQNNPSDLKVSKAVANTQLKLGYLEDANTTYKSILKYAPDDQVVLKNLAVIQVRLGRHEAAVKTFQRVLSRNSQDLTTRYNLAVALGRIQKYQRAVRELQQVIELNPDFVRGRQKLGEMLLKLGHLSSAEKELKTALSYEPQSEPTLVSLARVYLADKRPDKGIRTAQNGLQVHASSPRLMLVLGDGLYQQQKYEDALEIHESAQALDPSSIRIRRAIARDYEALGRLLDAIELYRSIDDDIVQEELGIVLEKLGLTYLKAAKLDEAIKSFEEARQFRPNAPNPVTNLALAQAKQGQLNLAKSLLVANCEKHPQNEGAAIALAGIHLYLKTPQAAIDRLKPLISGSKSPRTFHLMGLALMLLGGRDDALAQLRQAHRLMPNDISIKLDYGRALLLVQAYEEAQTILASIKYSHLPTRSHKQLLKIAIGYTALKTKNYKEGIRILDADNFRKNGLTRRIALALWGGYGVELAQLSKREEARQAFLKARSLQKDPIVYANLASLDYIDGRTSDAYRTWLRLSKRQNKYSALFYNIAIYFDDEKLNERTAYKWYQKYAQAVGGKERAMIAPLLKKKKILFGF